MALRVGRALQSVRTKSPDDVVLLSSVRSPITKAFKGGFKNAWPEDILVPVLRGAVSRANIQKADVQDILIGNVLAELGFAKTGRMAINHAGFPNGTTFHTVNRQCSSSLQAVAYVGYAIASGQIDVGIAGGVESMTRNYGSRGIPVDVSPSLRSSPVKDSRDCVVPMGITSENVKERYGVDRVAQDEYAARSHARAENAQKAGRFDEEIVPVTVQSRGEGEGAEADDVAKTTVAKDDTIRPGVTLEKLATLKPAFKPEGGSTAGNSSQVSDGASATVLARRSWAESRGLAPIGRFAGLRVTGCAPDEMGIAPVHAIPSLLGAAGLAAADVDVVELNEAFASQTIYCLDRLRLDPDKVNPNGGAIALGHPTGATGARQLATLMAELGRRGGGLGVVSMCASTGMGVAGLFVRE
ncbi:Thiolase, N-terminal domain-containing protein [Lineolata rhizophorae]|uniref:Thiolase, N-terminal domain-containing protein n=1 Tax=Lineolata rhizophorae TaxID=578093 RepID=A0A6A6NQP6_9PEZI|nr:Thiolase, N-terminal domain-containing protein [Lineolata rhizophorae]